jgi:general secretion pathway protein G
VCQNSWPIYTYAVPERACAQSSGALVQQINPCRRRNSSPAPAGLEGFTLVELLTAVAIIGILSAIAIPAYSSYCDKAQIARTIAEIHMLETSIVAYTINSNRQPDALSDIGYGNLLDPWGHAYRYLNIADGNIKGNGPFRKDRFLNPLNSDFDLYSIGADGQSKLPLTTKVSQDDIVRANNGGFVGLASDF